MAAQSKEKIPWLLIFLLILLGCFLLILVLPTLNAKVNTSTQTQSEGQCLPNGQGFDEQQEAFTLAQTAVQYRTTHPYRGNYALGSYTICYSDGTQQRVPSPLAPGYTSTPTATLRANDTHSEQGIYNWLKRNLTGLSIDQSQVAAIYTVIFSQVRVCGPCKKDMVAWQRGLRQAAKTVNVFLSIWDIRSGSKSGFDPAQNPAGTNILVSIMDLEKVTIVFAP